MPDLTRHTAIGARDSEGGWRGGRHSFAPVPPAILSTGNRPSDDSGSAEVLFKKYIAMDRHGAELSGELYGDEDQPGSEDEKNDGKMTLKLKRR
jgi:hypothetical protein